MKLAEWITNEQNQIIRFEKRDQGPSNIRAAGSAEVQANIALAAIAAQAQYSGFFNPGGSYWEPADTLMRIIADGNQDGTPLQTLLDNAVAAIQG